jgi:hypothetical protein
MKRLAPILLLLAAPVWAQIERTTIERTTISAASTGEGEEGAACSTKSRTFDATSSQYLYSANGDHAALEPDGTKDVAVYSWIRPVSGMADSIFVQGDATSRPGWRLSYDGSVINAQAYDVDEARQSVGTTTLATEWYCVVAICERGSNLQIYVYDEDGNGGGAEDASPAPCPDGTFANAINFDVASNRAHTSFYTGRFGTFAYFATADASGIVTNRAAACAEMLPCSTLQGTYGATACWAMDGDAGENEADEIGSVDLTQVNSPGSADGPGEGCE